MVKSTLFVESTVNSNYIPFYNKILDLEHCWKEQIFPKIIQRAKTNLESNFRVIPVYVVIQKVHVHGTVQVLASLYASYTWEMDIFSHSNWQCKKMVQEIIWWVLWLLHLLKLFTMILTFSYISHYINIWATKMLKIRHKRILSCQKKYNFFALVKLSCKVFLENR